MLVLEIGLSIKILGFDIADTLIFSASHHNHVSWEELVLVGLYEVAHFDVTPTDSFKPVSVPVVAVAQSIVLDCVLAVATVVFVSVLAHRGEDHKDKGWQHRWLTVGYRDYLDGLHNCDHYEVDVGCFGQLLKQIDRQESEKSVLARHHNVALHLHVQLFKSGCVHSDGASLRLTAEPQHFF